MGGGLYCRWIADYPCTYQILYCDGNSPAQAVRTETFLHSAEFTTLGGGVYAYQRADQTICIVDAYGNILGEIKGSSSDIFQNANGLLAVYDSAAEQTDYYAQDGTQIPVE